jgi:hypothetical protein
MKRGLKPSAPEAGVAGAVAAEVEDTAVDAAATVAVVVDAAVTEAVAAGAAAIGVEIAATAVIAGKSDAPGRPAWQRRACLLLIVQRPGSRFECGLTPEGPLGFLLRRPTRRLCVKSRFASHTSTTPERNRNNPRACGRFDVPMTKTVPHAKGGVRSIPDPTS